MKKSTKKLQLQTESVRVLTKDELDLVAGGLSTGRGTESRGVTCTCPENGCYFSNAGCLG